MSYDELLTDIKSTAKDVDKVIMEVIDDSNSKILKESSRHLLNSGGKRVRPYVLLQATKAVGGEVDKSTKYVAAAAELLHNYSLVHDDIMDEDELRRGKETIHKKWGDDIGILAGDFLFSKVFESISYSNLPPRKLNQVYTIFSRTSSRLCEGQVQDLLFENKSSIKTEDCEEMLFSKTGALFRGSAKSGAVIGSSNEEYWKSLADYGSKMGIGFQIWDDVLDLMGDEDETGKPVGSDIAEGKRTLIVSHFLEHSSKKQREEFLDILGSGSTDNVRRAIDLLESTGSIDYAGDRADKLIEEAKNSLNVLDDSEAKNNLRDLAEFIINRSY